MKKQVLLLLGIAAAAIPTAVATDLCSMTADIRQSASRADEINQGTLLYENFDECTGMASWIPLGWEKYSEGSANLPLLNQWLIFSKMENHRVDPVDGLYFAQISPILDRTKQQDEWLIMPELAPRAGDKLSFYVHFTPLDFFKHNSEDDITIDEDYNVNWVNQTKICSLALMAQVDGGDFVTIHDFADEYMGIAYGDLSMLRFDKMQRKEFDLNDYVGKKVRFAFRYTGTDGTTVLIDAVKVGYEEAKVSYAWPESTLYYGLQPIGEGRNYFPMPIAVYPVFSPVVWTNTSEIENGSFIWAYMDPLSGDAATSTDADKLELIYYPDYSNEHTFYNNLFTPHVLHGGSPNHAVASFAHNIYALQAGGAANYLQSEATDTEDALFIDFGMLPFSPAVYNDEEDENLAVTIVSYGNDNEVSLFGHSANTDAYWRNLTGIQDAKIAGIYNTFTAPSAPIVLNGAWLHAYGRFEADAEFTFEIFRLNTSGEPEGEAIISKSISGAQVLGQSDQVNHEVCLRFHFDEPVVLAAPESYAFRVSGFNSDKVSHFCPLHSKYPDVLKRNNGYIDIATGGSHTYRPLSSFSNDFGDLYGAFAISLDACYPWLETKSENSIYLGPESTQQIVFESNYDAADFTISAPEWLEVTPSGSRNKATLTLKGHSATYPVDGTLTVSIPGYTKTFSVHQTESGISAVETGTAEAVEVYTIGGTRVPSGSELVPGVYILRHSDGSIDKKIVR